MSLTHAEIVQLHQEIKPLIEGLFIKGIKTLSPRSFIMTFCGDKNSLSLLLCLQENFLRFHLVKSAFTSQLRSPFVEKLSETLHNAQLQNCSILNNDRILSLKFKHGTAIHHVIAEFFPRRPNCYLVDGQMQILAALNHTENTSYQIPLIHPHSQNSATNRPFKINSTSIANYYAAKESEAAFTKNKHNIVTGISKALKRSQKNLQQRQQILQECKGWKSVQHHGQLLQANLFRMQKGISEISVADWEKEGRECLIHLDPRLEPKDQAIKCFQRSKKLRMGEVHAEKQLQLAQNDCLTLEQRLSAAKNINTQRDLDDFCHQFNVTIPSEFTKAPAKKADPPKPYQIYLTEAGLQIWVGKSAKNNDKLTFQSAKGSDWWLHARDYPGSHVVLRCLRGQDPDADSLNDAAELALRFSKAFQNKEGDVLLSQIKYLSRIKGSPGKVQLSKHKVLHIRFDDSRWVRLKNSKG